MTPVFLLGMIALVECTLRSNVHGYIHFRGMEKHHLESLGMAHPCPDKPYVREVAFNFSDGTMIKGLVLIYGYNKRTLCDASDIDLSFPNFLNNLGADVKKLSTVTFYAKDFCNKKSVMIVVNKDKEAKEQGLRQLWPMENDTRRKEVLILNAKNEISEGAEGFFGHRNYNC